MDSRRLPGKVLAPLAGRPVLTHVIERLQRVAALREHVVIATSDRGVDDPIANFAARCGRPVFRGEVDNVAGRLLGAARQFDFEHFFRINVDCPFVDPNLLQRALKAQALGEFDVVTNLQPRSFPYGINVELIKTDAYAHAYGHMTRPDWREHPPLYLYESLHEFRYFNLLSGRPTPSTARLTLDTTEDLHRLERVMLSIETDSYLEAAEFCAALG